MAQTPSSSVTTIQSLFIAVLVSLPLPLLAQTRLGEIVELPGFAFKYSVATSASAATIWQLWIDIENWKEFDALLEYSNLESAVEFGEGAKGYLKAEGAPRVGFEIRDLVEHQSFSVHLQIPLFQSIEQQRYFDSNVNGMTVFSHEVRFSGGLSPLLYLLLNRIYKRETAAVVNRIKMLAER